MNRSNYTYRKAERVVYINDLNMGGMSVTNDIENIIDNICIKENIDKLHYVWIYNDSEGVWDGFDPSTNSFYFIGASDIKDTLDNNSVQKRLRKIHLPYNEHE